MAFDDAESIFYMKPAAVIEGLACQFAAQQIAVAELRKLADSLAADGPQAAELRDRAAVGGGWAGGAPHRLSRRFDAGAVVQQRALPAPAMPAYDEPRPAVQQIKAGRRFGGAAAGYSGGRFIRHSASLMSGTRSWAS